MEILKNIMGLRNKRVYERITNCVTQKINSKPCLNFLDNIETYKEKRSWLIQAKTPLLELPLIGSR